MSEARLLPKKLWTFKVEGGALVAGLWERDGIRCYSRLVVDQGEPLPGPGAAKSPFGSKGYIPPVREGEAL